MASQLFQHNLLKKPPFPHSGACCLAFTTFQHMHRSVSCSLVVFLNLFLFLLSYSQLPRCFSYCNFTLNLDTYGTQLFPWSPVFFLVVFQNCLRHLWRFTLRFLVLSLSKSLKSSLQKKKKKVVCFSMPPFPLLYSGDHRSCASQDCRLNVRQ